jgi:hypothetical protein
MHRNGGTHLTRIVVHYTPEYPPAMEYIPSGQTTHFHKLLVPRSQKTPA